MSLFIIVISLIFEFMVGRWQELRRLDWVTSYRDALHHRLSADWTTGWPGLWVLLGPIVIAALLLQYIFAGHMFGLLSLLFGILVLTYCLGPESFDDLVHQYLWACEEKDVRRAEAIAKKILLEPPSTNVHQMSSQVTRAIFYEANKRLFAVLFWFLLLGPAGALLYRVVVFLAEEAYREHKGAVGNPAMILHGLLDWAPTRLLALTFFMAGSYDDALRGWRRSFGSSADLHLRNRMFVILTGCAAMRHEVDDAVQHPDDQEEYDLQWLRAARILVIRSLIIWVTVVALLTLAGFFV
ncbi:MAG TPA: regulatory signaling modulator protein AmpE [Gammaproteobacteria bacterium]